MAIHHATQKKAEKAGFELNEQEDGTVTAFWPKRALKLTGSSASDVMQQMQAAQALLNNPDFRIVPRSDAPRLVTLERGDDILRGSPMTPFEAFNIVNGGIAEWLLASEMVPTEQVNIEDQQPEPNARSEIERSENGVALDGGIAYREGTPAGDNPFSTEDDENDEYDRAVAWDEAWDAAADEAGDDDEKGGSVVNEKYRAKYAELGHPTHCGDWLANLLNNLCITKTETDLGRFEAICAANGVDLTKYNRDTPGWQGRLRMTGRNLLAKRVYFAGGVVLTPVEGAEPQYTAPADWMTTQRFKMPKSEQAKPIPEAAPAPDAENTEA